MNENVNDPAKYEAMNEALTKCSKIVAFHTALEDACLKVW